MRHLIILAALLLGVSCSDQRTASDGYVFGDPTWVQTKLNIAVVLVPSETELRLIGPDVPEGRELKAFAKVSPDGTCTIYKLDSRVSYQPEWDGHELNHCIFGSWHD
jgi:hypothetical protein